MGFASRHIGTSQSDQQAMLEVVGAASVEELMDQAVPNQIRSEGRLHLPPAATEEQVARELAQMASHNTVRTSMIGQGFYDTATPAVIRRGILENPSWYTAYTPYQPEISQGRLEALLGFQTVVSELTGLPIAGASLLDEASAGVEAVLLAVRVHRGKLRRVAVSSDLFEASKAVLANRCDALGIEIRWVDATENLDLTDCAALVVQYPGAGGVVHPYHAYTTMADQIHAAGGTFVVIADLLACSMLVPPGRLGADVVAGSAQRLGIPLGGGGPHAAYIATTQANERQLPGRLVGVSRDSAGHPAFRLSLQTREQHIRREKATSNICTAQSLLAIVASMYVVYHGPEGLKSIAETIHAHTLDLARKLCDSGHRITHKVFFDTVELEIPGRARPAQLTLLAKGIAVYMHDPSHLRISCDELTETSTIDAIAQALEPFAGSGKSEQIEELPAASLRTDSFLEQATFHRYRSETDLMRYMRRLGDKDYALDRGMIPLGSCTMKLNAAVEVSAMTLEGFAHIHPYAPPEDHAGFERLAEDLERWLCEITGYDAVSLQPNAGSQGELAGLLAVRGYHRARGEARDVCLIPASAHGTNAASATLAGFRVVVVTSKPDGSIDLEDLRSKIAENKDRIGAIMLTYPSTHGIYEESVDEVISMVHQSGGQVYIDGANLNAMVGFARPGDMGGDVSHLNLHKTFAIPHGGGGPGVGPVAAKAHLAPYLPGFPGRRESALPGSGAVAAAPWGSASVLPISWAYIRLMGAEGLSAATASAVLAANYIADSLDHVIPVLYRGSSGRVAHECILDVRGFKQAGISVDDVAKRLVDYGFHAPTMSFPVPGTLMVEPTESEGRSELDRFCAAMLSITEEVTMVATGHWPREDNPLVNAPHTAEVVVASEWNHPYSREIAAYPAVYGVGTEVLDPELARYMVEDKYWPPVGRVDGPWGDRNLQCTCPPPEAFTAS